MERRTSARKLGEGLTKEQRAEDVHTIVHIEKRSNTFNVLRFRRFRNMLFVNLKFSGRKITHGICNAKYYCNHELANKLVGTKFVFLCTDV